MTPAVSRRRFLLGAGAGVAGVLVGATTGCSSDTGAAAGGATDAAAGGATDADIGFCSDMSMHHIQAMAMCQRVLGRDTGGSVQAAAVEVLQTQSIEVGMMRAWLADWGASTDTPEMVMGWMGMNNGAGMPAAMMPGLASDDEMRELAVTEGLEQGRLWLTLMRAHHVGGINMANAAIDLVGEEKVQRLARTQSEVQTYEVSQYDLLLATEYAEGAIA